jgi:hypothetical protein
MKKPTKTLATTDPFTADDLLRGQQLTEAFRDANGAIKRVFIFGAMMLMQREAIVSTRGHVRTGGAASKGDGLKAWLEACAPEVAESRPTAYRYMALAEGLREELKLGKKADLTLLLTASGDSLTQALRKKQAEIDKLIQGKSQRQLLLDFGKAEPKRRGGYHPRQGPAPTPEEKLATQRRLANDDADDLMRKCDLLFEDNAHTLIDPERRRVLIACLAETRRKIEAVK